MGLREAGETHLDEMDERSGLDAQPQNEEGEDGEVCERNQQQDRET